MRLPNLCCVHSINRLYIEYRLGKKNSDSVYLRCKAGMDSNTMNIKVNNIGQMSPTEILFRKVKECMNPVFRPMLSEVRFAIETKNLYFNPFTFVLPHGRGAGALSAIMLTILYAIEKDEEYFCKEAERWLCKRYSRAKIPEYHIAKTQNRMIKGHVVCLCTSIDQAKETMEHMEWAIEKLGMKREYQKSQEKMYIEKRVIGQRIYFMTIERFKEFKGQFKYVIFPDVDRMKQNQYHKAAYKALINVQEDVNTFCFVEYLVPAEATHWTYEQFTKRANKGKTYHRYFGTYKTMPKEYLGEFFYREADILKTSNPKGYENDFLGKVTIKKRSE